uniref:Type II secretory pathway, component pulf n=1 Tax=uncultured Verrucomicrobiales bacterium HF4000_13K17 TaxID=710998 RepID=E0XVP7_9BACT|nr:type II secretory pathway, component pulf [uncultured Verrucomicrobiales bacterium HF4000_13K17]
MAVFNYTARDASGGQTSGTINSPDRNVAVSELMSQGLTPISVLGDGDSATASKRSSLANEEAPARRFGQRRKKPKLQDLANFTRQLANLLKAGMPLTGALNSMTSLDSEGIPKSVCAQLLADVREGRTLSMSMGKFPEIFPDMYLNMVKAGESSGSMVEVLKRLADHYERFAEVRQKIISALVYPMFVMGLGFLLIFVFMSYILPKFMTIFKGMKVQLPLSTRILEGMSGFFENWWWLVLIMGGLFVFFLKSYLSSPRGRERFDGWILEAPLISRIVRPNLFGQFSRTLGALLQNGVPVLTALRITESVVQNVVIQQAIAKTREGVTDGKTLAQPLARGGVFPKLLVDLVHIGEQTGDVPAALNNIAETYDNELTVNLRTVTTLIEPILIMFIAGAVAFMLVGVLQAMFTITSTIGR